MRTSLRLALSASALLAASLLVAGCTAPPTPQAPESTDAPGGSGSQSGPDDDYDDIEAAWLDDGRTIAIVTWGSSSCVPMADTVTANGQTVEITLVDGTEAEKACTADMSARASVVALPAGVDPTKDVELRVTLGDITDDTSLDGNAALTGIPGEPTEYLPSAGWFDDEMLVLLTWGSSTCPPIIESVEASGSTGTVTFAGEDRVCTMDMAPRATVIGFDADVEDDAFVLTLVGDNLDGTLEVIEG